MSRGAPGRFFEDFVLGETIRHATPRTVTAGDAALYIALTGTRFALTSSAEMARAAGYHDMPVDDLLTFNMVFGKSVPDLSVNAIANLGYADGRFGAPVYAGDTITATSEIIGLRQNSNGKTGTVYARTTGRNQSGAIVIDYVRWVMVRKRDPDAPAPAPVVPELPAAVPMTDLAVSDRVTFANLDHTLLGSARRWFDYAVGERLDHVDGVTVEEAEHMIATRLYQNTARVHFDQQLAAETRFGRRIVYGGHVISLARALSFNGLAGGVRIAALNAGTHTAPVFAGDTLYAWSEVLERSALPARDDVGALRVRTVAVKNQPASDFPLRSEDAKSYVDGVVLDFDYTILMPAGTAS